ncbi:hypothetical protein COY52_12495 [Candidatus Desantisbacteria bacterium CG_4_10_14_0_8_um_filter_48_22]|uniref:LamG-like jellyroll fold domain-containing protein n=1 Tax=Candidatus Desantisbacteria bacterium CG_4_10_14_0_8_um_filter_48_22 TaxID=1974543 RepID=A0A2M7S4L9_9BACT|nr:MAG: hypothetical protein COY52_12495 [Candidatus Desantisbacteria bacterium CG_4_10_14_0_8_um_filter_48_22]
MSEIRADSISAATAWTQLSKVVISPSEAHGILYRFQNWGVGTVWFDYARLSRIPTIEFVGPVEIAIITPPRTVFTGSASESIAIEVLDNFGEKAGTFNETVGLLSSSVSGRFSTDKFNWSTSNDSSITLGSGSGVFYYLDTAPNSPVITVYRQGLISDTQIVEVLASISASEAASYLRIVSPGTGSLPANGINQCRVAIFIRDSLGNPLSGRQVTIITSRGSAMDTITQPGLTDSNGQSTGTIVSSVPGQDTVVAFCEGVTITENVLPNPSFENGTGTPISWSYNTWTGSWSMVSDITYSGASAIRHTCASAGDNFTAPSANKSVIPGSAYRFTQYTKTDLSSGSAVIRIIWWDGGIVRGDVNSSGLSGNSDWTLLSALFSVPADAYQMEYRCMQGGVGTAWFDCVRASRVPTIEFTSADKLAIITPARTLVAGSVSESICVQAQMADGSKAANFNANCQFLSSNGLFCDTQTGETWSSSISLRVVDGETYVYYKGTKAGPSIITVKSPGLPDTTQVQLITPGVFSETASYIVISPRNPIGDGQNQCKIRVVVTDIYYNPIPGATVLITTSRKGTSEDTCDTITQPSQPTDENGMATGIVVSSLEGKDTITATVTGEPGKIIELTFFNSAPAGRWDFDEAGGDIAGSPANSGRLYGPTWAQGKYGSSLSFNGSTDYVSVPDTDSLDPQQISVELWFYRTGTTGDSWMINKVTDGAQGYRLGFGGDGYVAWHVPLTPWSHYFTSPYAVPLYQWTHVVGTSDGSKLRLYVNGVETATLDRIGGINPSSGDLYIGSYGGGGGYNFPGLLDGVRIYNKALSAEEVRADYEGRRKKPITWAAASKIAFLTPPRTIVAGSASESIVVQAQWSDGSKADNYNEDCEFSSSSPTGRFSAAPGGENWASSLTLRFVSGETYVFFKDIKPGSYTLTVRSGSLSETTQAQYVNLGDFSETASYIIVGSRNAGIDGITPCPVIAVVTDRCRNPVPGKTVVITTSRKGTADDAYDTITYPNGQVTDTNGWCTGLLVSTLPGKDTITAYLLGDSSKTIKNTIFKDNLLAGGWNFDEGEGTAAYDVSPYKNNGSLTGSPAWASGYYGSGLEFTGTGNYVTIPDTDSLHFSDELTAELWLKRVGEGTWLMYIDKSNSFQLRRDPLPPTESGNFTSFVVIGAGWEPRVNSGIQPGAGIWYHVVTTYDKNAGAGNLKIYVNGEFKASSTRTGSIDSTSNPVNIGTSWPGVIDEVRLYNKALPADEIVASYEGRQKPITFRILATQLKITNSPFKAKSGQAVPVTVVAEDGVGNVDSNFNEAANLLTSSESGSFSLTQNWVNINTVTLTNGSAAFYYRDYLIGSPVITITHSGLTPAAQQETITASKLQFLSPPFVISSIQASDTIAVVARDESGNTDTGWNETASLKSTSSKGRFSLGRESWSDTSIIRFSSGSIVFFYKDSRGGAPVITITSSDIISSQKETIVMPVILLEKFVRNEQLTGQDTQTIVLLSAGDTLEFRLKISNVGGETAINLIITDTITFNTAVYTPVAFLSMDSETIADSWTYAADPAGAIWEPWNSSPPAGAENIKGLRWGINTLGVNEQRSIKFRVRVK